MACINLLPWREQLREERKRNFRAYLLSVVVIAAGLVFLVDLKFREDIAYQQSRNAFLGREILQLDARIAEIDVLRKKERQINLRMEVIQDLQHSRPFIVRIFDTLVETLPAGVYFNNIERLGEKLKIEGVSESNNKVSELMRRIDDSQGFLNPSLQKISAASADEESGERTANVFSLILNLQASTRGEEK